MTPTLSVPTDNIYKFLCLFGLALIVVSVFSTSSVYISSLDKKVFYQEDIIKLEAIGKPTPSEANQLALDKKLLEVTSINEKATIKMLGYVTGTGLVFSVLGFWSWHTKIQARDDRIAALQEEKLKQEILKLKAETQRARLLGARHGA